MRLITDNDRSYILAQLTNASDEVLVRAYRDWDAQRLAALEVRGKLGGLDKGEPTPHKAEAESAPARRNVNPGLSTITKIGGTTKSEIMAVLNDGRQPPAKYIEHCKLLWERSEICFDGEEWYL